MLLLPREYQSGSPFSVSLAIFRDGCPPQEGQSAAHAAVAEKIRDNKRVPAAILLDPVEGCGAIFIDMVPFTARVSPPAEHQNPARNCGLFAVEVRNDGYRTGKWELKSGVTAVSYTHL